MSQKNMIKMIISNLIYRVAFQFIRKNKCEEKEYEKSVSVVFLGALGDFIVFCSAAKKLIECGFKINLIFRKGLGIEEIAKSTGFFADIIPLNNRLLNRIPNICKLRKIKSNYVFAAPLSRYPLNDIYTLAVTANVHILPEMVQDCKSPLLKCIADKKADMLVPVTMNWEWDRYTEFLRGSGFLIDRVLPYSDFEKVDSRQDIISVFPGASVLEKMWTTDSFAWVINRICEKRDYHICIVGSKSEYSVCEELSKKIFNTNKEIVCGTSISNTMDILRKSSLALANDSGSAHMALFCSTPTVAVCGMWQSGRFFPNELLPNNFISVSTNKKALACMNCGKSIPDCTSHSCAAECICNVSPQDVLEEAFLLLKIQQ